MFEFILILMIFGVSILAMPTISERNLDRAESAANYKIID